MVSYRNLAESKVVTPSEMEEDLSSHIKKLADVFHGITVSKCCILAFQFAQSNNLKISDNWTKYGRAVTISTDVPLQGQLGKLKGLDGLITQSLLNTFET